MTEAVDVDITVISERIAGSADSGQTVVLVEHDAMQRILTEIASLRQSLKEAETHAQDLERAMPLAEKIEANADLTLWFVHILGPDDVLAAPSHEAAAVHARELNKALHGRAGAPSDVMCFAYAAPWPHSRESHAEDLPNWLKDKA